jgi:hypothetical protein
MVQSFAQVGEFFGVLEPARLLLEYRVLTGMQCGTFDLVRLEAQEVRALRGLATAGVERVESGLRLDYRLPRRCGPGSDIRGARERVENEPLRLRVEQRLVLVLAMQIHQAAADLSYECGGRRGAIDPCPAAPLDCDLAAQDDQVILRGNAALLEHRRDLWLAGDLEHSLDNRTVATGAHDLG